MVELSLPERLYQENPRVYDRISGGLFKEFRRLMPFVCVDGYVKIGDGVLLIKRKEEPAKNLWWPLGGRMPKGLGKEEAIKKITKREVGLDVEVVKELGLEDLFWDTNAGWLGDVGGTHDMAVVYALRLVDSNQELVLDKTSSSHRIITPEEYQEERGTFHQYVDKYLPEVFGLLL